MAQQGNAIVVDELLEGLFKQSAGNQPIYGQNKLA